MGTKLMPLEGDGKGGSKSTGPTSIRRPRMSDKSVPSPADKRLAMRQEDPDDEGPDNIEQLPLDIVMARLRERGVDPTMPDSFRELVEDKRRPAEALLSLLDEENRIRKVPRPDAA